jgi:hypothetical protein
MLYLGVGLGPVSHLDPQRVVDSFGEDQGFDLLRYVQTLLDELYAVPVDWTVETLASATDTAVQTIAARHPELSEDALDALKWKFGYDSR